MNIFLSISFNIWATTRENLSLGFRQRISNKSPQLQRRARNFTCSKLTYDTFQKANNKGADQTARMCRLVCACVDRKSLKTGFLTSKPIYIMGKKQNKRPLGLVRTVGLMIYQFCSQELHQDTICEKFIPEVTKLRSESHMLASLEMEVDFVSLGREINICYGCSLRWFF